MNEIPASPNPMPPQIPGPPIYASLVPLGSVPEGRKPVTGPVTAIESILREPRRVLYHLRQPGSSRLVLAMLGISVARMLPMNRYITRNTSPMASNSVFTTSSMATRTKGVVS